MKYIRKIIIALSFISPNIYAYGIDGNIAEMYEPDRNVIQENGFIVNNKQKNLERYQMEVKYLKKEEQEKFQNQSSNNPNTNDRMYQNVIDRHGNELMARQNHKNNKV